MDESLDKEITEGKIFAVIGYWFFLCILPLIFKKNNKFAVYHAKQGLVMFVFLVGSFIFKILPQPAEIIWNLALFIYVAVFIWGNILALSGKFGKIPLVSKIADKIVF